MFLVQKKNGIKNDGTPLFVPGIAYFGFTFQGNIHHTIVNIPNEMS